MSIVQELFDKHGFDFIPDAHRDAVQKLFARHLNEQLPSWKFTFMQFTLNNPRLFSATDPAGVVWNTDGISDLDSVTKDLGEAIQSFTPVCERFLASTK